MKNLYRKTFDRLELSEAKTAEIMEAIANGRPDNITEIRPVRRTGFRRAVCILAAVMLLCSLGVVFASGDQIYSFITGGSVHRSTDGNDGVLVSSSFDFANAVAPVETGDDGRVYLTVGGKRQDISDEISIDRPFIHECIGEDGLRHAFIIGGSADALGWAEFIWDAEGIPSGGNAFFPTPGGRDDAPWMDAGLEELGLPW